MDYIKSIETMNFRLVFKTQDNKTPDGKIPVQIQAYGNSEDGMKFCASPDALKIAHRMMSGGAGLNHFIKSYELSIPMARGMGYLDSDHVKGIADSRITQIPSVTPSVSTDHLTNPMDSKALNPAAIDSSSTRPEFSRSPSSASMARKMFKDVKI